MRKTPTIYDVAERAGVSKSLVSLVLRGSPRVSDEKREAVLAAVAELDYTPSRLAAGLAGTRTRSVGVVIDEFENLWFATALAGLRAALADGGYSLSVADAALNSHLSLDPLDVFRSLRVDGLVLAGEVPVEAMSRLTVPAVTLGTRAFEAPGAPVFASDERSGGRLATAHLADLGHRDIVCVSGPGASAGEREAGYVEEMRARGLEPRVIRAGQTSEAAARAAVAGMFEGGGSAGARAATTVSPGAGASDEASNGEASSGEVANSEIPSGAVPSGAVRGGDAASDVVPSDAVPTAVFAVNDPMAVGVIGAARDHGLETPRDLSVVGYDDSPLAAYELISLTSVSGDTRELGEAAGRALVRRIEGGASGSASDAVPANAAADSSPGARGSAPRSGPGAVEAQAPRLFQPRLVVRASTAPR